MPYLNLNDCGVSDADLIKQLREQKIAGFLKLSALLGDDSKALLAMRAEGQFVRSFPGLPCGEEFASMMRGYLISQKLEWNVPNLIAAVKAVAPEFSHLVR